MQQIKKKILQGKNPKILTLKKSVCERFFIIHIKTVAVLLYVPNKTYCHHTYINKRNFLSDQHNEMQLKKTLRSEASSESTVVVLS